MKIRIIISALIFLLTSCYDEDNCPVLTVINNSNENIVINSVRLTDCEFNGQNIKFNESKTFVFDNGLENGLENRSVKIIYSCGGETTWTTSDRLDFDNGIETVLYLNNCIDLLNIDIPCENVCASERF